jgi:hypothetical protein
VVDIFHLRSRESDQMSKLILSTSRPRLKPKFKVEAPVTVNMEVDRPALKRKHDPEETIVLEDEDGPARKKIKPNNRPSASPTKAQRLEEDGLVLLEDDVTIVID